MRKVEFVLLCEDVQHERFIRRYLRRLGFNARQFRVRPHPAGSRSGEQWVRERYPAEVGELRRRANHTTASLVAMTDADTRGVDQRAKQLDDALHAQGQPRRGADERIALVVPRRNIESWIHFAIHGEVDETTDFKSRHRDSNAREAADVAVQLHRSLVDEAAGPPSLVSACRELRRVVER